ncbi:MAG: bifunctional (p)ppGpp synthetase/guanosine-3',5'-bis(diphosphate) 3'-pyrophosphohydrolase [bacterium]|nr:bifunctional (p)ppGpp synthetase/guanosine-3',5'-bis(diphosphate) 3'-pyrophosphohydrolase [bacterium]
MSTKRYFELQEKVLGYHADANIELLKKAYSVAADAHINQKRATNEPYIIHPLKVAGTLADMKLDEISIAAGLLHDVVEDTDYTRDDITKLFGTEISDIVWGVTKISKISEMDAEDAKAETLKKMILAMTNDVRVILIKLADRFHNIGTLDALRPEKQKRIAKETLDIYAPIAYRLGMGKMKTRLEDISFKYAYPEEFEKIAGDVNAKREWATGKLESIKEDLEEILKRYNIKGVLHYRIKREISIYRKLHRQSITLDRVYDLLAMRIVTDTIENCYALMGEIHQQWTFIPARWRDFIATPKSNGYQSIHTTVMTKEGVMFEIQIRTAEMHRIAEEGIAAHWKYKEGIKFLDNDQRLQWFRDMIDTHKENPNPRDFLSLVKGDLTPNEVYVFTPKGKVINMKKGATPIDFAYAIHSEVGDHCKMAIVNETLVPLKTGLNSGDVVEIVTARDSRPSIDWLKYVATNRAKKKILNYIQKREYAEHQEKGKRMWNRVLREYKRKHKLQPTDREIEERIGKIYCTDMEGFFRLIGSSHKTLDKQALKRLFPEVSSRHLEPEKKPAKKISPMYRLVKVEGYKDIDVNFARCCNPIKGDKIAGFITKNRGLVIHKVDCVNLRHVVPIRLMTVTWNEDERDYTYLVRFEMTVTDKPGLLSSISTTIAGYNSNIRKIENEQINQQMNKLKITFEVKDTEQLNKIRQEFEALKDVYQIVRKRA